MAFSNDGAKMFVIGDDGDDVNEYTLFAPPLTSPLPPLLMHFRSHRWESSPTGMAFSSDGTKMFVIG